MTGANLYHAAHRCLMSASVPDKLAQTAAMAAAWRAGDLVLDEADAPAVVRIERPGRPERPRLVSPRQLAQRGLGSESGRAALVHAVAHIEFNAINLAWDAVYRFRGMPRAYYDDWVGVADDEARHFSWLAQRLAEYGLAYGDLDGHDGLWQMAVQTDHDCLTRMALVPRVLEARGLDVTPGMIERLRSVGDPRTVAILEQILSEEIGHVAAGSRWFGWCCEQQGLDPELQFSDLLERYLPTTLKGPLNHAARRAAGFGEGELLRLLARAAA